ncbi:MAG TPA: hypothetical protein VD735_07635 [Candidatus Saccharimonadales bacterium]|nr:hypothetical protein [Candidatus Saccharimonadales bacterium]
MIKVHFSAPLQDIPEHIVKYNLIISTIKTNGQSLVSDWLDNYQQPQLNAPKNDYTDKEWESISSDTLTAIAAADVVIIDASIPSFSMGYIAAQALAHKKPLLILFESKQQPYILDNHNSLKRAEVYNSDEELVNIVTSFLRDNDTDAKDLRFNMVLDRESYNLLHWEAVNTGKTKAQIIREVIKDSVRRS